MMALSQDLTPGKTYAFNVFAAQRTSATFFPSM